MERRSGGAAYGAACRLENCSQSRRLREPSRETQERPRDEWGGSKAEAGTEGAAGGIPNLWKARGGVFHGAEGSSPPSESCPAFVAGFFFSTTTEEG